jgi:glutaredoxin 3
MIVTIYTRENCPNCITAKQLLTVKNIPYNEVDIEFGERLANFLKEFPDARQMPQIFINDQRVGGLAGLRAALKKLGILEND